MNYLKTLVKILLIGQCFLLCVCDTKKEKAAVVTPEQQELNLTDFVKCPFNEEFNDKTNLEKYVLKKFGKPDKLKKWRGPLDKTAGANIITDEIEIGYSAKYAFGIQRGVSKKFEVFETIAIKNPTNVDLKYGINEETTMRDIKNLFGEPLEAKEGSYYYRYSSYNSGGAYVYHLHIYFENGKLYYLEIKINIVSGRL